MSTDIEHRTAHIEDTDATREDIAHEADEARERLGTTLDELDRRRRMVRDAVVEVKGYLPTVGIGAAMVVGGIAAVALLRRRSHYSPKLQLLGLVIRGLRANSAPQPSFTSQLARRIVTEAATILAVRFVKHMVDRAEHHQLTEHSPEPTVA